MQKKEHPWWLATLLIIIVVFASGFFFLKSVMSNIDFAKTIFNTQMKRLLLESFSANVTHIIAVVKNTANQGVELTLAYVNNMLATMHGGKVTISPQSTEAATIITLCYSQS
ncbi:hypothetical protein KAU88_06120 [Candidatus Bathyarchaeota archaeon]|nr:hypothetical protein [Candidatus Bathyarchaeota archaeon]